MSLLESRITSNRFSCVLLTALLATSATGVSAELSRRARDIAFTRVDMPADVPAHLVTALAQDRRGFLWIGTQSGLVRYDGYTYKVFATRPGDPRALGSSYIRTLLAASDGRIWAGTFSGGVSVYDPATEAFRTYRHDRNDPASLAHDRVEGVAEDHQGHIWLATDEGLDRLDPKSGRIEHFRHRAGDPSSLADDQVRGLLIDRSGVVWAGTRDGLQRWRGGAFERVASAPGGADSLAGQLVNKIVQDSQGRLWIGTTEHGGAVVDLSDGSIRRLRPRASDGLSHFWVYAVEEASDGAMWIGTFGAGIDVVDPRTLAITARLRHDAAVVDTIGGDRIGALLRDRSGLMWAGTWGEGLARHDATTRAFVALRHSTRSPDGLSHPAAVRALQLRDGAIWVGTNGAGIDVFDETWRRIGGHRPAPGRHRALSDGAITCLAQGADGSVWVATLDGTLHRYRAATAGFDRLTARHGLPGGPIRSMTFGPDGELWAASANGLARIDPNSLRIDSFRHATEDAGTLSARAVESLAVTPDGTLWVGTNNGLNAFDRKTGRARRIYADVARADALPNAWVPDLITARDGRLWVGTQGGACVLTSWDGTTARFERVADRVRVPPRPAESLIEDAQGHIWIGPRLRIDPKTWAVREFGAGDARDFRSYFIASRATTRDGGLLFGSPEGLLIVHPARLGSWTYQPPLATTSIEVDGAKQPEVASSITLTPRNRGFRVDFAALDLTAPGRNQYRYRLEGFDERWTDADATRRSLTYTSLPPGDYTLRVQGTNRAGQWSEHEIVMPVAVEPAVYQTLAFRIGTLFLIAIAAYGAHRLRVARIQARGRELEAVVAARTVELRDAYARIEEASLTDALTGLRNRRFIQQAVDTDAASARRMHAAGEPAPDHADLVFFLVDLDHFKQVNDVHGHAAGDAVLTQIAEVLRGLFRASDHVARWGGEEFLVVARFTNRGRAPEIAEKIRAAIAAHAFTLPDGTVMARTCSIGFAAYPGSGGSVADWPATIEVADAALYRAKREGRNRWIDGDA
jgi:diguanylate cyclase (GGDEF)-like protein